MSTEKTPLFRDLNAEDPEPEVTEIESLCMNCHADGMTRLLLTKIPHYKEVVVMSFSCNECGYQNNELQSGGQVSARGIKLTLTVEEANDLNRQVVRSDYTSVKIVELDFEIPSKSQKGDVTTVEGVIDRAIAGLEQDQVQRRIDHPEVAKQLDDFIEKLRQLKRIDKPFTLVLEDISGNTHIENPNAPHIDPNCRIVYFNRTKENNHDLGLFSHDEINGKQDGLLHPIAEDEYPLEDFEAGDVMQFKTNCNNCGSPCDTNMKLTSIPHFKEVVIMATVCDYCGHRTNEVKSSGGIEETGLKVEITIKEKIDLSRDVLKSETCSLSIPELEFEVGSYALGGRFTTVEGIIMAVKEQLGDPQRSHMLGDSTDRDKAEKLECFLKKIDEIIECKRQVTLILDDPAGNSYIQSLGDDDAPDDRLKITRYERNFEQNEELGLNDMKVENYSED